MKASCPYKIHASGFLSVIDDRVCPQHPYSLPLHHGEEVRSMQVSPRYVLALSRTDHTIENDLWLVTNIHSDRLDGGLSPSVSIAMASSLAVDSAPSLA